MLHRGSVGVLPAEAVAPLGLMASYGPRCSRCAKEINGVKNKNRDHRYCEGWDAETGQWCECECGLGGPFDPLVIPNPPGA